MSNPYSPYGMGPMNSLTGYFGLGPQPERGPSPAELLEMERKENESEAMRLASDNNKTVALAQIHAQEFAMQQASLDREMQIAAQIELGLERLDTSLQMSKMEYIQHMSAEENRHREAMVKLNVLTVGPSSSPTTGSGDFPMPEEI